MAAAYTIALLILLPSVAFIAWAMFREYRITTDHRAYNAEMRRIGRARRLQRARAR